MARATTSFLATKQTTYLMATVVQILSATAMRPGRSLSILRQVVRGVQPAWVAWVLIRCLASRTLLAVFRQTFCWVMSKTINCMVAWATTRSVVPVATILCSAKPVMTRLLAAWATTHFTVATTTTPCVAGREMITCWVTAVTMRRPTMT